MKKKLLASMLLLGVIILLCTACNQTEQKDQTSNNQPKTTENKQQNKKENNSDKMLEVLKKAAEISKLKRHADYGYFMVKLGEDYDNSVKNPYTNETSIHILNRGQSIIFQRDNNYSGYSASVAVIDTIFDYLKNLEKTEVTYGCNPDNKGVVMAFVYQDGFYIYQVDEKGEKQNEITYIFPGYEYPEWVDEYKE